MGCDKQHSGAWVSSVRTHSRSVLRGLVRFGLLPLLGGCVAAMNVQQSAMSGAAMALSADMARLEQIQPTSLLDTVTQQASWVEVPVFYGTRRNRLAAGHDQYYGEVDAYRVEYGSIVVSFPEGFRPGRDDTRGLCRFLPSTLGGCRKNQSNSVTILPPEFLDSDIWLSTIRRLVDTVGTDALLYVHGYNNSFRDAVERTAKLAYGIGFPGVAVTFDWPSLNAVPTYSADQTAAMRSLPDFKRFVARLSDSAGIRRIAIVSHSMGTSLVSNALRDLRTERPDLRFGPVILAAADIDSAVFMNQLAAPLANAGYPITVYASTKDRVLQLSGGVVNAGRRVGSGPPSVILHRGIDYVDASNVDTDLLGHGYFVENKALVDDVFLAITHRFRAEFRNLVPVSVPPFGTYFRIR